MDVPSSYKLLGHTITVEQIPPIKWRDKDCVGTFEPQALRIRIRKGRGTVPAHTFCHELTHSILSAMSREDLNGDEEFVDTFSGLLHQALTSAKYK